MSQNVANKNFHAKTKALVKSAIGLLASYIDRGEQIPYKISEKFSVTRPGELSLGYVDEPDWYSLTRNLRKEIEALPEYAVWTEAISADAVLSKHVDKLIGTRRGMISRSAWEYFAHLLLRQLQSTTEKLEFTPEAFEKTYGDLERFFYDEKVQFRAVSPLQNFECDREVIDLGVGLKIRRITTQELEQLAGSSALSASIPFDEIIRLRYVIEFTFGTEKAFGKLPSSIHMPAPEDEVFGKLVTALRLFKAGATGLNIVRESPVFDTPAVFGGTRGGLEHKRYWGPEYKLTESELDDFKSFWKDFNKVDLSLSSPLGIAISRFNYAYEKRGLEDKLIDYMIAFEALFFKTGEIGEFRHKLAVRVAKLLAVDFEDRKAVMKEIAEFYDKRSEVVHGERPTLKTEFIEKVGQCLRQSIKHFMQQLGTAGHDEIISHLDLA